MSLNREVRTRLGEIWSLEGGDFQLQVYLMSLNREVGTRLGEIWPVEGGDFQLKVYLVSQDRKVGYGRLDMSIVAMGTVC